MQRKVCHVYLSTSTYVTDLKCLTSNNNKLFTCFYCGLFVQAENDNALVVHAIFYKHTLNIITLIDIFINKSTCNKTYIDRHISK